MSSSTLRAGSARADITPAMGIQLAGDIGRVRPTEEIRERLYAGALALESGDTRLCLVSLDLLGISTEWANEIRARAARRFGLDPARVILHVVQNHASPTIGHCFVKESCALMPAEYPWLRGGDERYNEPAASAILDAIGNALAALRSVRVETGRGIDGRVAFNLRFVMRDGSGRCHPPTCSPDILHTEGPADPEVGVMRLVAGDDSPVAILLHHTCHPCHGYPERFVIGDWPGAWAELARRAQGKGCEALVINGCCGNIHHANHLDPTQVHDHRLMAGRLQETAAAALGRMTRHDSGELRFARRVLRLPLRRLADSEVEEAREYLRRHPEPEWNDAARTSVNWDWVYAVMRIDLKDTQDRDPLCDYEIAAVRLGDAALVTLMGEPFVEAQLRIKRESPAPFTWVAHFCHGYAGYLPTSDAFTRGGYETRTSNGSKFEPDALETVTRTSIELLKGLFP